MRGNEQYLLIPVAPGEVFDKISILEIKDAKITDPVKLENVRSELSLLQSVWGKSVETSGELEDLCNQLRQINLELWNIEDDIRDCERGADFSDTFIQLARAVYITNDKRAQLKKDINLLLGSKIIEEKSYAAY